jgi:hypothetical protein
MKRFVFAPLFLLSVFLVSAPVFSVVATAPSTAIIATAHADEPAPAPSPSPTVSPAPSQGNPDVDFATQVFNAIKGFGGMNWLLRISTIILLLGATMKVSFLRPLWDKLGSFKTFAGPLFGLVGGLLAYFGGGTQFSLAALVAYMFAGSGAIALHELLDAMKGIPGLGAIYVGIIDFVAKKLGGSSSQA